MYSLNHVYKTIEILWNYDTIYIKKLLKFFERRKSNYILKALYLCLFLAGAHYTCVYKVLHRLFLHLSIRSNAFSTSYISICIC